MDTSVHEEPEASLSDFVIEFVKPYASEMFSLLLSENNLAFSFYQCYLETLILTRELSLNN